MRLVFAGGGTGGHLFPGLALARAVREARLETEVVFVGTREGLDAQLVPAHGFGLELIAAGRGSPLSLRRPLNAPRFALAVWQSLKLLRSLKPAAVVALGGFAAAAPGVAAGLLGVPLALLEQNTVPGRVNRLLARWARRIFSQFAECRDWFRHARAEFVFSGSPAREEIAALAQEPPCRGECVLAMGGSQGARDLNRLFVSAAGKIAGGGRRVLHLSGGANEAEVRGLYAAAGVEAEVIGFADDMPAIYRRCRLAVSRSGAGAVAELALAGLPAIFVPLPSAMDNHQSVNAGVAVAAGGAVRLEQGGLDPGVLAETALAILRDEPRRTRMAEAMRGLARPEAAARVAAGVLELAGA